MNSPYGICITYEVRIPSTRKWVVPGHPLRWPDRAKGAQYPEIRLGVAVFSKANRPFGNTERLLDPPPNPIFRHYFTTLRRPNRPDT